MELSNDYFSTLQADNVRGDVRNLRKDILCCFDRLNQGGAFTYFPPDLVPKIARLQRKCVMAYFDAYIELSNHHSAEGGERRSGLHNL